MKAETEKAVAKQSKAVAGASPDRQSKTKSETQFEDRRPLAVGQRALAVKADSSPQAVRIAQLQAMADGSAAGTIQRLGLDEEELLQGKFETIQKQEEEEELLQGKFETIQRQTTPEAEELLQGKFGTIQRLGLDEEEPLQGKVETMQKQEEEEELLQGKFETTQRQGVEEEEELLQGKFETIQKQGLEEEELLQGKFETTQRQGAEEEEELLQGKFETIQRQGLDKEELQIKVATLQKKEEKPANDTGLPDRLKSGIEKLSGLSLDDVKVHYNSPKPAQLRAHAFAQGTNIHIASGQEKHLPHEAWHVVQQKQGRVKPTLQMKGEVNVNDDAGLEKEADVMGAKALQVPKGILDSIGAESGPRLPTSQLVVQRLAVIGDSYAVPELPQSKEKKAIIDDPIPRRFKDEEEFNSFAAGQKLGVAGELPDTTWVRVDQFQVLGENHGAQIAPQIINALGTNKYRYEGFVQQSASREAASPVLKAHTESRDEERVEIMGLSDEVVEGQTHEAEHILPKQARALPDVIAVAKQQAAGYGQQYVKAGEPWADGYGLVKTLTKNLLDALIYARSYEGKFWGHGLKSFYKANAKVVNDSILALMDAEVAEQVPNFQTLPVTPRLQDLADTYNLEAKKKLGVTKGGAMDAFKLELDLKNESEVTITDEAKEADYLRDLSMLKTIKKAKGSGDILFIVGDAHREKLKNLLKKDGIPSIRDKDYIKNEETKNKAAKYGKGVGEGEKVLKFKADLFFKKYRNKKMKYGEKLHLKSLKQFGGKWEIDGRLQDGEVIVDVGDETMNVNAWLVPPFVKESLLCWSGKIDVTRRPPEELDL